MEFKQLESFVAVVRFKSFTKAANYLFISQPTISTPFYRDRMVMIPGQRLFPGKHGDPDGKSEYCP